MNYEDMSDFEINKAVAKAKGLFWHVKPCNSPTGGWLYSDNYELCGTSSGQIAVELHDYCNNPSDSMQILIENKIGFKWVNGSCTASSVKCGYHESTSDSPLRAAMIVFLMMNEQ